MVAKTILRLIYILIAFTFVLLGGQAFLPTYAAVQNYSNVLTDLQKDESFNADDYPIKQSDYSLQVIQIAESTDGELLLYTYQPCQLTQYLIATSVNMALSESVDGTELYSLTLLSSSSVFCKYLVNDVKVSSDETRYYNISSIFRAWDIALDGETGTNNTGNYKSYSVGKVFVAKTENGKTNYTCKPTYVINVIAPYADFLVYITNDPILPPSLKLSYDKMGMLDSHYIAFSTDLPIDRLMSATVKYNSRAGSGYYNTFFGFDCGSDVTYSEPKVEYAYPTYKDKFQTENTMFSYNWDRIQTVDEFISNERLTDETISNLQGKQWVIRFVETPRTQTETNILGYKKYTTNFTKVDEVAVLRLEFETGGKVYNLGTVSDIVSGDDMPGNVNSKMTFLQYVWSCIVKLFKGTASTKETIVAIVAIVAVLAVVSILLSILSIFFPVVGQVLLWIPKGLWLAIKYISIGIWFLISAPFRLIAWLVNRH